MGDQGPPNPVPSQKVGLAVESSWHHSWNLILKAALRCTAVKAFFILSWALEYGCALSSISQVPFWPPRLALNH